MFGCFMSSFSKRINLSLRFNIRINQRNPNLLFSSKVKPPFSLRRFSNEQKDPVGLLKHSTEEQKLKEKVNLCIAYGTAENYNFDKLKNYFNSRNENITNFAIDKILCRVKDRGEIFYFDGTLICWGFSPNDNTKFLQEVKQFEINPYAEVHKETIEYVETPKCETSVGYTQIFIQNEDKEKVLGIKLALSYALYNSTVVSRLESICEVEVKKLNSMPDLLILPFYKKIFAGRLKKNIRYQARQFLRLRGQLNLYNQYLDFSPDLFWDTPHLETPFRQMSKYLEVGTRMRQLNSRIDHCIECISFIYNDYQGDYSSKLEWLIIILIAIEVLALLWNQKKKAKSSEEKLTEKQKKNNRE